MTEIDHLGDARRQASMRLVVEGLDAEIAAAPERALSRYQRAIQIDPGNPFAYLTLARYYAAIADPERALEHLGSRAVVARSRRRLLCEHRTPSAGTAGLGARGCGVGALRPGRFWQRRADSHPQPGATAVWMRASCDSVGSCTWR